MSNFSISNRPITTIPGQTVTGGGQADQATGAGALGQSGPVPDVGGSQAGGVHAPNFQAILGSILEMMPEMTSEDQEVKLLEITVKLREMEDMLGKEKIKIDTSKKQTALAEKQAKLDEAQKKIDEAKEKMENMSIWDKIKCAFQWLGAILSIAIGALLIATGAGAVAGGLLIAAGITGIIMAIDATVKLASPDGVGIAGSIAMSLGKTKEQAQEADMIFGYVMVAVSIALALASLGATVGPAIANAVMGLASGAGKVAMAATAAEGAVAASTAAKAAQTIMTIANDVLSISTAVGDAVVAGMKYDATQEEAKGTEMKASAKQMEAFIQLIDDMIDQTMARMRASTQRFDAIIDDIIETIKDRGDSLSQAKFTA